MIMAAPKLVRALLVVAPLLAIAGSCVESRHPLSDEKTSKIDERLIGTWGLEDDNQVWQIQRSQRTKNALDLTVADGTGKAKSIAFTTTVKSKAYMSIADFGAEAGEKLPAHRYDIFQYVFVGNDSVVVCGMDSQVISKAIADKTIGGEISVTKVKTRPFLGLFGKVRIVEEKSPVITDGPEGIAKYLAAHSDECYPREPKNPLVWKRQKSADAK
jgi:hypothetical protein